MKTCRIIIFAKAPEPGRAKTRLIPALGAEGAARLARKMFQHTVTEALAAGADTVELCMTPGPDDPAWSDVVRPDGILCSDQAAGSLGERLARASARALGAGDAVLLIGTDCPDLDAAMLRESIRRLHQYDAVMVPALDGGYALLGFKRFDPSLFEGIAWSTNSVAAATTEKITALSWSLHSLPTVSDIDEPADLGHLPAAWT